jgi:uncharacterized cupredoxin-like copper-binding protein
MVRKTFFTLVLATVLTACTGAGPSQTSTEISVDATDFSYSPNRITVPAGQPITLTLNNLGAVEHDFVIEKINVTDVETNNTAPAAHHQMGHEADYDLHVYAKAKDSAVLNFTTLEPGTYEIFCSVEGHKAAGMIGTLVVVDQG